MRRGNYIKHYWIPITLILGAIALLLVAVTRIPVFAVQNATTVNTSTLLGNNAHTGYNANETIINPTSASHLSLKWTAQAAGHITDQVLSVNDVLYWGSWDGQVHATSSTTGHDLWATNVGTKPGSCAQN